MKITKEKLQKIIQEELEQMQQEGEVDEGLGTFLKSFGSDAADVARTAVSGISGAISAAKEASKKADEEAARVKEETRKAAERIKTSADVEAVIGTAVKQVSGLVEALQQLMDKMEELEMPISEPGLDLKMIIQQLRTAGTALYHGGKKAKQLSKGKGPEGFKSGDTRRPPRIRPDRPSFAMEEEEE